MQAPADMILSLAPASSHRRRTSARRRAGAAVLVAALLAGCAQSAAPATPTGTAHVAWARPTLRADGTPLIELRGFRIRYGSSPQALYYKVEVAGPAASSWTVGDLTPGTWYFVVTAIDSGGLESAPSAMASKVIR